MSDIFSHKIEFKFALHDECYIHELKCKGYVIQMNVTETGKQYQVRYFLNGKIESGWFYHFELDYKK